MYISLEGQTALVTGSTAGIGRAIAEQLSAAGAHVIVNGRDAAKVDAVVAEIAVATGGSLAGVAADVTDAAGTAALIAALPQVDILVNNAGRYQPVDFLTSSDRDWRDAYEVNVVSAVRLTRAYFGGMLERKRGRVIFLSSDNALISPEGVADYSAAKAALLSVSRTLAKLARGTAITVNAVLPGATLSRNVSSFVESAAAEAGITPREALDRFVREALPTSLIERGLMPQEVANMVTYLCSSLGSGTTGSALRVDGGSVDSII